MRFLVNSQRDARRRIAGGCVFCHDSGRVEHRTRPHDDVPGGAVGRGGIGGDR